MLTAQSYLWCISPCEYFFLQLHMFGKAMENTRRGKTTMTKERARESARNKNMEWAKAKSETGISKRVAVMDVEAAEALALW